MMWVRRSSSKLTRGGDRGGKLGEVGAEKVERCGERGRGDMAAWTVECFRGERKWVEPEDKVWGARCCMGCLTGEAGATPSAVSQGRRWERFVAVCDDEVYKEEEEEEEEDSPMAVAALCTATASATLRAAARARATAVWVDIASAAHRPGWE